MTGVELVLAIAAVLGLLRIGGSLGRGARAMERLADAVQRETDDRARERSWLLGARRDVIKDRVEDGFLHGEGS